PFAAGLLHTSRGGVAGARPPGSSGAAWLVSSNAIVFPLVAHETYTFEYTREIPTGVTTGDFMYAKCTLPRIGWPASRTSHSMREAAARCLPAAATGSSACTEALAGRKASAAAVARARMAPNDTGSRAAPEERPAPRRAPARTRTRLLVAAGAAARRRLRSAAGRGR